MGVVGQKRLRAETLAQSLGGAAQSPCVEHIEGGGGQNLAAFFSMEQSRWEAFLREVRGTTVRALHPHPDGSPSCEWSEALGRPASPPAGDEAGSGDSKQVCGASGSLLSPWPSSPEACGSGWVGIAENTPATQRRL